MVWSENYELYLKCKHYAYDGSFSNVMNLRCQLEPDTNSLVGKSARNFVEVHDYSNSGPFSHQNFDRNSSFPIVKLVLANLEHVPAMVLSSTAYMQSTTSSLWLSVPWVPNKPPPPKPLPNPLTSFLTTSEVALCPLLPWSCAKSSWNIWFRDYQYVFYLEKVIFHLGKVYFNLLLFSN